MGMDRKVTVGPAMDPAFRALPRLKRLRGTRLDPFGLAKVRRVERELPGEYRALVQRGLTALERDPSAYDTVVALCELPDLVRGYEEIKLRNVAVFRQQAQALLERLDGASPLRVIAPPRASSGA
jgi:indolepyruvate ferredoxin oxidoreductase